MKSVHCAVSSKTAPCPGSGVLVRLASAALGMLLVLALTLQSACAVQEESSDPAISAAPAVSAEPAARAQQPQAGQVQDDKVDKADKPKERPSLVRITRLRDKNMMSPKSVLFSPDGSKFYINALEAGITLVYDTATLKPTKLIRHFFGEEEAPLFQEAATDIFDYSWHCRPPRSSDGSSAYNHFFGKPVECVLTHNGRYLWITYYRRNYDNKGTSPSAMAVVDTQTDTIVRVLPTGPVPKMITASPDGRFLAVTHWGDNSVALFDIASDNPKDFRLISLLAVGKRPNLASIPGNREKTCGNCLRGTAFSKDGRHLFVGRMRHGGIAVFDTQTLQQLGYFMGVDATPRHLVLSHDGSTLYASCTARGTINAINVEKMLASLVSKPVADKSRPYRGRSLQVGHGARTLTLSPDGKWIYVACNQITKLVLVDVEAWKVVDRVDASAYPVGAAVHPDGTLVVTTSQGRNGRGGHVADVFRVQGLTPLPVPAAVQAEIQDPAAEQTSGQTPEHPEQAPGTSGQTPLQPAEAPLAQEPGQSAAQDPASSRAGTPAADEAATPADQPAEKPADQPLDQPLDQPAVPAADKE